MHVYKHFKIVYSNGEIKHAQARNSLELIRAYDLSTKENINTRIIELEGEQLAIAISNLE